MKKISILSETKTLLKHLVFFILCIFVFAGLGFGIYFGNLNNQFVYTDAHLLKQAKRENIEQNPYAKEEKSMGHFSAWDDGTPMVAQIVFSWQRQAWKKRPFDYHLLQLCLHLFCSAAICFVFLFILKCAALQSGQSESPWFKIYALAASAVFLCHPIGAAGASWVSAQKNLLAVFFLLVSTGFYMYDTSRPKQSVSLAYAISVCFYAISVFTGTISVLWIMVMGIHGRFASPESANRVERIGRASKLLPFLLLSATSIVICFRNKSFGGPLGPSIYDIPASLNFAADYLKSALYPFGLTAVLLHKASHGFSTGAVWGAVSIGGAFFFCLLCIIFKRFYIPGLICAWFLAVFIPHSFEVHKYMTDIRPYLASAMIPLLFLSLIFRFRTSRQLRAIAISFLIALIPIFGIFSFRMAQNFQNGVVFWKQATAAYPKESRCWHTLGTELTIFGDLEHAERALKKSIEIEPNNPYFYLDLGRYYVRAKNLFQAEKTFTEIYNRFPDEIDIQKNLWIEYFTIGNIYLKLKKYEGAKRNFNEVISMNPTYPYAHAGMAVVLMEMGDYYNAYKAMAIAAELAPDSKEIRKSRDYVLKKARKKGYKFEIKGITKPFFDLLNQKKPGTGPYSRNKK